MTALHVKTAYLLAKGRIRSYIGIDMTEEILGQAMALASIDTVPTTPNDLYRIGIMLEENQDNAISAIGVSMKVKALLLGAETI